MTPSLRLASALLCAPIPIPVAASAQIDTPAIALEQSVRPHECVDIGGRKLTLFCIRQGEQTVLFNPGGNDWAVIWGLVHPHAVKTPPACSYDWAWLGYSDPTTGPRSRIAIVEGMKALVTAPELKTPLVPVGHSLGGFNMKFYAAFDPGDVAGIVLIDPSEDRVAERVGDAIAARVELNDCDWMRRLIAHYQNCAAQSETADLAPNATPYKRCSDPVPAPWSPAIAPECARIQVNKTYQATQASENANSVYVDERADAIYRTLLAPGLAWRPSADRAHPRSNDAADPIDPASYQSHLWLRTKTVALSGRGRQRVVPWTNHYIEIDDRASVAAPILEVSAQVARPVRQ